MNSNSAASLFKFFIVSGLLVEIVFQSKPI
ncbi:MAG: hypothetical protein ACI923_000794 [Flavobacteriales bacterium]|jgi:hypothetical protein